MERFEGITDWEAYAKRIQIAWEKEHSRQTAAYQNLETEMTKLLQLLQESQQNQSDFMMASAKTIDACKSEFRSLQQEVRSFLMESRNMAPESDAFARVDGRLDDILKKLSQFGQTFVREQRTSSSVAPQQHFSNSISRQESSPLTARNSSSQPHESSTYTRA